MAIGDLSGILALGFVGGLWVMFLGVKACLLVQKIKNTPTSKVASAAVGMVELFGKARPTGNLKSPVCGVPCGFWRVTGEYFHSGKNPGWRLFYSEASTSNFYLEDETGRMLVDPSGAEVEIPSDAAFEGYISGKGLFGMIHKKIDSRVIRFIRGLGKNDKLAFWEHNHHNVRIIESYIADGDVVYVLGTAQPREKAASPTAHENLVVKRGGDVMYISDSHEKKITESFDIGSMLNIAAGLIVSSVCLFFLLLVLLPSLVRSP